MHGSAGRRVVVLTLVGGLFAASCTSDEERGRPPATTSVSRPTVSTGTNSVISAMCVPASSIAFNSSGVKITY